MSTIALSPNSPASSGEIQAIDFSRVEEVQKKHDLLVEYLQLNQLDSLLLLDPANYAWFTAGSENLRASCGDAVAAILVTTEARVVLSDNINSGQIFDRGLMGLGFLLKERPWTEDRSVLLEDVCRGRRVGCDVPLTGTVNIAQDLHPFRNHLSTNEYERVRELGMEVAHAIEATGRNFPLGATEAEVAGHLAHRLMKNRIQPVRIQVLADGQGWRYRNWSYGDDHIERHCVISVVGRRYGLHVSASRTVCVGEPSEELANVHQLATLVQATGIFFSRPGWKFCDTWSRVQRIYEKFAVPDEWRAAEQATLTGYRHTEVRLPPQSTTILEQGQLINWHPSVRSSSVGDTFLISANGIENLTPITNWPIQSVRVKGAKVDRPGILVR